MGERQLDLIFSTEGTAHVPAMYVFDATTDFPLTDADISAPNAENLWGGDHLGLVTYRDEAHILHYRDFHHPVATSPLSGGKACQFSTNTIERTVANAIEPGLCRNLANDEGPPSIEFKASTSIDREAISKRYSETTAGSMCLLDFSNDGLPENVVELNVASGAGAGCDAHFYDTLDQSGQNLASNSKHDLLMKLQNAEPSNRYPILPCSNKARFFSYHGKVHFESKPTTWPPIDEWNQYHRVTRIDRGRVIDVCNFKFETSVSYEP